MEEDDIEQHEQWRPTSPWAIETTAEQDQEERASWSPPCTSRQHLSYLTAREIAAFVVGQPTNYDVPEIIQRVTHIGYLGCKPPIWMVQSTLSLSVTQLVQLTDAGHYAFVKGAYMRFPEEEKN
jgi:hypothetical protein